MDTAGRGKRPHSSSSRQHSLHSARLERQARQAGARSRAARAEPQSSWVSRPCPITSGQCTLPFSRGHASRSRAAQACRLPRHTPVCHALGRALTNSASSCLLAEVLGEFGKGVQLLERAPHPRDRARPHSPHSALPHRTAHAGAATRSLAASGVPAEASAAGHLAERRSRDLPTNIFVPRRGVAFARVAGAGFVYLGTINPQALSVLASCADFARMHSIRHCEANARKQGATPETRHTAPSADQDLLAPLAALIISSRLTAKASSAPVF